MRLSLLNWPPIASHTVCILIGFALSNLQGETQNLEAESKKKDIQNVWIPMKSALLENSKLKSIKSGGLFFLVKTNDDNKTFCKLSTVPITLNKSLDGPILEFKWRELPKIADLLTFPERSGAKLSEFRKSKLLKKCLEKNEVTYDFFN